MRHFMWVILYESNYMSHGKRYLYIFEFNVVFELILKFLKKVSFFDHNILIVFSFSKLHF